MALVSSLLYGSPSALQSFRGGSVVTEDTSSFALKLAVPGLGAPDVHVSLVDAEGTRSLVIKAGASVEEHYLCACERLRRPVIWARNAHNARGDARAAARRDALREAGAHTTPLRLEKAPELDSRDHIPPSFPHRARLTPRFARSLPSNVNAEGITARVTNGLLSIAVPKKAAESHTVVVSSAPLPDSAQLMTDHAGEGGGEEKKPSVAKATLLLPGLGSSDVCLTLENDFTAAPLAHIKGASPVAGTVHEVLRLPARAVLKEAAASLVNGVLTFTCPVAPLETTHVAIVDAAPADSGLQKLFEAPIPGVGPDQLKAEAHGRSLVLSNVANPRSKVNVQLPKGTALGSLVVVVTHGIISVLAPKPVPHTTPIAVAGA